MVALADDRLVNDGELHLLQSQIDGSLWDYYYEDITKAQLGLALLFCCRCVKLGRNRIFIAVTHFTDLCYMLLRELLS